MKFQIVQKISDKLINGGSNITFEFDGIDAILQLYDIDTNDLCYIFKFKRVVAFRHIAEGFKIISESYEKLILIQDSDWIEECREIYPDGVIDKWKHYALFTENDAQYEIIALDCEIESKIL